MERYIEALEAECQVRLQPMEAAMNELRAARLLVVGCHRCRRRPDSDHCPVRAERLRSTLTGLVWDQAD